MHTNPRFSSDGFEIVDDPDSAFLDEDDLEDYCIDDAHLNDARQMTPWQKLEARLGERQLRADLCDWDYWDEYLAAH